MNKNSKASTINTILSGKNIYKDKHGNTVYYKEKENLAYKISPDKEKTFQTYSSRYSLDLIAFVLFYILFKLNIFLSLLLTLTVAAFLEFRYRSFLKRCPQSVGFVRQEKVMPIDQMIHSSKGELILRIALYGLLAILLIFNSFYSKNVAGNTPLQVVSYVIAIFAGTMTIKYVSLLIRKN